jgi:hypothetical protein
MDTAGQASVSAAAFAGGYYLPSAPKSAGASASTRASSHRSSPYVKNDKTETFWSHSGWSRNADNDKPDWGENEAG